MKKLLTILLLLIISFNLFAEVFISPSTEGTGFGDLLYTFNERENVPQKSRQAWYGVIGANLGVDILFGEHFSLTPSIKYSYEKESQFISTRLGFNYVSNGYSGIGWACGIDIGTGCGIIHANNPIVQNIDLIVKPTISIHYRIEFIYNSFFIGASMGGDMIPTIPPYGGSYGCFTICPYVGYRFIIEEPRNISVESEVEINNKTKEDSDVEITINTYIPEKKTNTENTSDNKLYSPSTNEKIYVNGYYRKDGTYVHGYWRKK